MTDTHVVPTEDRSRLLEALRSGGAGRGAKGMARPGIPRVDRSGRLPASYAQRQLWFLDQLTPGSVAYVMYECVRLRGPLDVDALNRAVDALIRRHETLRTVFSTVDGTPVQQVLPEDGTDGRGWAATEVLPTVPGGDVQAVVDRWARRPFDLRTGPLLRALLVAGEDRAAGGEHVFALAVHHIAADGWSMGVLLRELSECYSAFLDGTAPALTPLSVGYLDYATWQRGSLAAGGADPALDYWRERLAGAAPVLPLPRDRSRPVHQSFEGGTVSAFLDAELAAHAHRLALASGATVFMVLLAAFDVLLARLSGQDDVLVGVPVAGRPRVELESPVGFFATTVVQRTRVPGDASFTEVLARVREATLGAFAHQDVPFELLLERLETNRQAGYNPVFQVMFSMQNAPAERLRLRGTSSSEHPVHSGAARMDLSLNVEPQPEGGYALGFEYDTALFDEATVRSWARCYQRLLAAMLADPDGPVGAAPLLAAGELERVLAAGTGPSAPVPAVRLPELVAGQAARTPDAPAVSGAGGVTLSYAELEQHAAVVAARLRAIGVTDGSRVAVFMDRSPGLIVALLGVLQAGAAYVPVDPSYPPERVRFLLADADARAVITQEKLASALPDAGARLVLAETGDAVDDGPAGAQHEVRTRTTPDDPVYVIYTSGSTGTPKGVMVSHRAVVNRLTWMVDWCGMGPGDRVLQKTPYSFDVSVWELFAPLICGATVVVAEPGLHRDPSGLARLIAVERVTIVHFVPAMLGVFLDQPEPVAQGHRLRLLVCSGEALPADLPARVRQVLGDGVSCWNLYGPTEAAVDVTAYRPGTSRYEGGCAVVPIGTPIANARVHVLDQALQPVPVGVVGEVCIGGVPVGLGYLGRPGLTASVFVPDPIGPPGAVLYRTGDLGRLLPDGVIDYVGRRDQQVKINGHRIELGEIEATLRAHPQVRAAVAVATPERTVWAYVVPASDELTEPVLRDHLRERLPDQLIPQAFGILAEFPLTPSGKVDRRALPALAPARNDHFEPPQGPIEGRLADLIADLLGSPGIGRHDDFFRIGGESIIALQLVNRALRAGIRLSARDVFAHPTVAGMAAAATPTPVRTSNAPESGPAARPDERPWLPGQSFEEPYPLSPMQHEMLSAALAAPEPGLHVAALDLTIDGQRFDERAFVAAWQYLMERHPVFRTAFAWRGLPYPVQTPWRIAAPPIDLVDLTHLPARERDAIVERSLHEVRCHIFDLESAPQWRITMFRTGPDTYRSVWRFSYMFQDGWSFQQVLRDLYVAYDAYSSGREPDLPPVPPFGTYVRWLSERDRTGDEEYWRAVMLRHRGRTPVLERLGTAGRVPSGEAPYATEELRFTPELEAEVRRLAREQSVTLFTVLQGAWALLLGALTGQPTVTFGTIASGRPMELPQMAEMVGPFNNMLPAVLDLPDDRSALDWLRDVQQAQADMRQHQYTSLAEIRQWAGLPWREPLYDTYLVYENFPMETAAGARLEQEWTPGGGVVQTEHPMRVVLWPEGGLIVWASYYLRHFDAATIRRLMHGYEAVIVALVRQPEATLSGLRRMAIDVYANHETDRIEDAGDRRDR